MAWARVARTSDVGASSQEPTWAAASFTPTADSLVVISVGLMHDGNSTSPADDEVISVSDDQSLTWTKRAGNDSNSRETGDWGGQHAVFTAPVGGSPSAMVITIDIDSAAGVDWFGGWNVFDITGHDVASPVVAGNSSHQRHDGGNSETHTHNLGQAPVSGNLVVAFFHAQNDSSNTFTTPSGYTDITNLSLSNAHSLSCYHETTIATAIECTDLGQQIYTTMASGVEFLLAGAAATVYPPFPPRPRRRVRL